MDRQAEVFKLSVPEADSDVEVLEFLKLIPMLTSPSQFGGRSCRSFTVVAPSLPGYGLSFSPNQPRFGVEEIADRFASLMSDVLAISASVPKAAIGVLSSPRGWRIRMVIG